MAVIGLDALILKWIWSVAGKETALQVPRGALPAAFVLGLFFLVPIFLAQGVGIAGRHLLLPSIPICIWVIATLGRLKRRRQAAVALAALGLAVAQGTAWTHVVAARINDAVYRTVKEQQPALSKADRLVVDLASFRERIAYSWVPRDFDYVNTYFGAQALEELGVESMVWLATGRAHPPVHFAVSRPVFENDRLTFSEGRMTGAREFNQTPASVPLAGTVVLDFRLVFGDRFNSGQGAR
jgi:hypothetical protein